MACQSGGSGWFEVWLVVIGAVLGFALSIITIIVNKVIDKHGKMRLFYRLVYQKSTGKKAGIDSGVYETRLIVPLYIELQNTSNTARVIRDACLYLYNNGNKVAKMVQIEYICDSSTQEIEDSFGGDKNSYSFVLPPLSIQKQECVFMYKVPVSKVDEYAFDEIRFSYYDEKNRIMECVFCKAEQGWNGIDLQYENEYFELKCSKKKRG